MWLLLNSCSLNVTDSLQTSANSPVHHDYDDDNGNDDDTGDEKGDDDDDDDVKDDDNSFDWTEILDDVIVCILVHSLFIIIIFIKAIIAIMGGIRYSYADAIMKGDFLMQ